jgi:hypothetical protein
LNRGRISRRCGIWDNETVKLIVGCQAGFVPMGAVLAIVASAGCSSRPTPVTVPAYDPQAFANALLARCDTDGGGSLSKQEAASAPGLVKRWSRYDANQDGVVSRDELTSHVDHWVKRGDGLSAITCVVRLKNRQIGDVTVRLVPDESLGGAVHAAETVSHSKFASFLSIPAEFKHEDHAKLAGMQYGLYRVEISHPSMKLVPSADSRGFDISPDDAAAPISISVEQRN